MNYLLRTIRQTKSKRHPVPLLCVVLGQSDLRELLSCGLIYANFICTDESLGRDGNYSNKL